MLDGHGDLLDPQALPGGRPLPGVPSGRLPAVAFSIEKFRNMSFYIGPQLFGIFVPISKLDIGENNIITARFYAGGNRAGNLSLVGADENGEYAGALLMLDLSSQTRQLLKSHLASNEQTFSSSSRRGRRRR